MPSLGGILGLPLNMEILVFAIIGIVYTSFDTSIFNLHSNLKEIWSVSIPNASLSPEMQSPMRILLTSIVIVRSCTSHLHLACYIIMLYPILCSERPSLMLPWLVVGAIKQIFMSLLSLGVGIVVCVSMEHIKEACGYFVAARFIELTPALYMWGLVYCLYREIRLETDNNKPQAGLNPAEALEQLVRRRRARMMAQKDGPEKKVTPPPFNTSTTRTYIAESRSLDTLMSHIPSGVDVTIYPEMSSLTPAQKTQHLLGLTDADVTRARKAVPHARSAEALLVVGPHASTARDIGVIDEIDASPETEEKVLAVVNASESSSYRRTRTRFMDRYDTLSTISDESRDDIEAASFSSLLSSKHQTETAVLTGGVAETQTDLKRNVSQDISVGVSRHEDLQEVQTDSEIFMRNDPPRRRTTGSLFVRLLRRKTCLAIIPSHLPQNEQIQEICAVDSNCNCSKTTMVTLQSDGTIHIVETLSSGMPSLAGVTSNFSLDFFKTKSVVEPVPSAPFLSLLQDLLDPRGSSSTVLPAGNRAVLHTTAAVVMRAAHLSNMARAVWNNLRGANADLLYRAATISSMHLLRQSVISENLKRTFSRKKSKSAREIDHQPNTSDEKSEIDAGEISSDFHGNCAAMRALQGYINGEQENQEEDDTSNAELTIDEILIKLRDGLSGDAEKKKKEYCKCGQQLQKKEEKRTFENVCIRSAIEQMRKECKKCKKIFDKEEWAKNSEEVMVSKIKKIHEPERQYFDTREPEPGISKIEERASSQREPYPVKQPIEPLAEPPVEPISDKIKPATTKHSVVTFQKPARFQKKSSPEGIIDKIKSQDKKKISTPIEQPVPKKQTGLPSQVGISDLDTKEFEEATEVLAERPIDRPIQPINDKIKPETTKRSSVPFKNPAISFHKKRISEGIIHEKKPQVEKQVSILTEQPVPEKDTGGLSSLSGIISVPSTEWEEIIVAEYEPSIRDEIDATESLTEHPERPVEPIADKIEPATTKGSSVMFEKRISFPKTWKPEEIIAKTKSQIKKQISTLTEQIAPEEETHRISSQIEILSIASNESEELIIAEYEASIRDEADVTDTYTISSKRQIREADVDELPKPQVVITEHPSSLIATADTQTLISVETEGTKPVSFFSRVLNRRNISEAEEAIWKRRLGDQSASPYEKYDESRSSTLDSDQSEFEKEVLSYIHKLDKIDLELRDESEQSGSSHKVDSLRMYSIPEVMTPQDESLSLLSNAPQAALIDRSSKDTSEESSDIIIVQPEKLQEKQLILTPSKSGITSRKIQPKKKHTEIFKTMAPKILTKDIATNTKPIRTKQKTTAFPTSSSRADPEVSHNNPSLKDNMSTESASVENKQVYARFPIPQTKQQFMNTDFKDTLFIVSNSTSAHGTRKTNSWKKSRKQAFGEIQKKSKMDKGSDTEEESESQDSSKKPIDPSTYAGCALVFTKFPELRSNSQILQIDRYDPDPEASLWASITAKSRKDSKRESRELSKKYKQRTEFEAAKEDLRKFALKMSAHLKSRSRSIRQPNTRSSKHEKSSKTPKSSHFALIKSTPIENIAISDQDTLKVKHTKGTMNIKKHYLRSQSDESKVNDNDEDLICVYSSFGEVLQEPKKQFEHEEELTVVESSKSDSSGDSIFVSSISFSASFPRNYNSTIGTSIKSLEELDTKTLVENHTKPLVESIAIPTPSPKAHLEIEVIKAPVMPVERTETGVQASTLSENFLRRYSNHNHTDISEDMLKKVIWRSHRRLYLRENLNKSTSCDKNSGQGI